MAGAATETAADSVEKSIDSAGRVGASLGQAAKGAVIGAVRGTSEVGTESLEAIGKTSRMAVTETASWGPTSPPPRLEPWRAPLRRRGRPAERGGGGFGGGNGRD